MKKMLCLMLASASYSAAPSAIAADLYGHASVKDAPVVSSGTNWTGLYFGGHAGVLFDNGDAGKLSADFDIFNTGSFDDDDVNNYKSEKDDEEQFIAGVHVGYNWQRHGSSMVLGVEGDVSFGEDIDYLASLRARLGYARGDALFYITGGVAFAEFNDASAIKYVGARTDISLLSVKENDDTETGFVVGGGVEYKIRPNVSFGLEALYYGFDESKASTRFIDDDDIDDEVAEFRQSNELDFVQVRARITYHLQDEHEPLK